ncbi:hypothetical protein FUAX_20830 [Fulvitalea axinellae]|uniref:Amidinotransferase n=1 Tax=Fulvitalea axinellae TaxID=1182444 RepID=A0AAU9CBW4_9BACT|nr:hypothetical protein FUAX_20830 [Fulvitalea axinellae]
MITKESKQVPSSIMMVRPVRFGYNAETAVTNAFQVQDTGESAEQIQEKALEEFLSARDKLREEGVKVVEFVDTSEPHTPDSIFPNNWISFHDDGKVVLYPMCAENRRTERRKEFIDSLVEEYGFSVSEVIDYSDKEAEGVFLEGTGSVIFDYVNMIAYANYSPRTDKALFEEVCDRLGFKPFGFTSVDKAGKDIYHANVLMCLGDDFAVVCEESIRDEKERKALRDSLEKTGHEVVSITMDQMYSFAGNMLEVCNERGHRYLVMSQCAYDSLDDQQLETLAKYAKLLPLDVSTIEEKGGGSIRCMMAGVNLPKA